MNILDRKEAVRNIFKKYIEGNYIDQVYDDAMIQFFLYHKIDMVYASLLENVNSLNFLKKRKEKICRVNQIYINEVDRLAQIFKDLELPYVILKGLASLISSYRNLGDRYFWDIDFLVRENDLVYIEKIFLIEQYIYGKMQNKEIVKAKREEILFQRRYTHELYNFIKMSGDIHIDIDINFKFSWSGINKSRIGQIRYENTENYIIEYQYGGQTYNIFDVNMQFVHLSCHFYNEAVYFCLDLGFENGDPKETRLFRLLDICLLFDKIDPNVIKEIAEKFECMQCINFVLMLIEIIMGEEYVKKYFSWELKTDYFNYYIDKNGLWREWEISMEDRIFDLEKKQEVCNRIFMGLDKAN